jgi:hypothetical protein
MLSKDKLAEEFRPLIFNISTKHLLMNMIYMILTMNAINHYSNVLLCTILSLYPFIPYRR